MRFDSCRWPLLHAAARLRRSGKGWSPGADVGSVSPVTVPMCAGERSGSPTAKHGIRPHSQAIVTAVDSLMSFGTNLLGRCLRPDVCSVQCSAVPACALTRTAARVCAERARPSPNSVQSIRTGHWRRCARAAAQGKLLANPKHLGLSQSALCGHTVYRYGIPPNRSAAANFHCRCRY